MFIIIIPRLLTPTQQYVSMATCRNPGATEATSNCSCFLKLQFQELPQIHSHAIHCNSIMSQIAKAIQQILSKFETWPYCYYWWYRNIITIPTDLNTVWLTWVISSNYRKIKRYVTPAHTTKVISKLDTSTQVLYNVEILLIK